MIEKKYPKSAQTYPKIDPQSARGKPENPSKDEFGGLGSPNLSRGTPQTPKLLPNVTQIVKV